MENSIVARFSVITNKVINTYATGVTSTEVIDEFVTQGGFVCYSADDQSLFPETIFDEEIDYVQLIG